MMQRSDPELNSVPHARRAWTGSTLPGQIPLSSVGDFSCSESASLLYQLHMLFIENYS